MRDESVPVRDALRVALNFIARRDRSEKEIRERLRIKGFAGDSADAVIDRLRTSGFLDDRRFAEALKHHALERKCLSVQAARRLIAARGIPEEIISEAFDGIQDSMQPIRRLIEKKTGGNQPDPAALRKLWASLMRRGFSPETIREALKPSFMEEDPL